MSSLFNSGGMTMDFKKYLAESEIRASQPVTGDQFDITINEILNIETNVVEHSEGKIVLNADPKMMQLLESFGYFSDESIAESLTESEVLKNGRDFKVVLGTEYRGFVMGDESYEDGEGFRKSMYGVFKPLSGDEYERVGDVIDVKTGKTPSPYGGVDYKVMYQRTVNAMTKGIKESASAGSTSSGSIASVPTSMGMIKRKKTDEVAPALAAVAGAAGRVAGAAVSGLARAAGAAVGGVASSLSSDEEELDEAEYQGKEVTLNKPTKGDSKKFKVYVKDPSSGNVKKVNFGDPNMEIKRDDPERRKSFRARHNCSDKKDKTKAGYWSCKMWSKTPVSKIV